MSYGTCWRCRTALAEEDRKARRCHSCGAVVAAVVVSTPTAATILASSVPNIDTVMDEHAQAQAARTAHHGDAVASAPSSGTLRLYDDGLFVTADGADVSSGEAGAAVPLGYKHSDVSFRIGAYDILSELGRGGMGVVYRAYSLRLCREVALKMMTAGQLASEADIARFQNEAMLAARLHHPNIVPVFDAGEHEGNLFFVMAFVQGHGFGDLIQAELEAPPAERQQILDRGVKILAKAARAFHFAHQRGIVHRDIKPDNILVDANDEPHITDFGIAKSLKRDAAITQKGAIIGTPSYMAPEQANSFQDRIGPVTDVYSLGATLYHLACGRPPYDGTDPLRILVDILERDPDPPKATAKKTLKRNLDPDLAMIIGKAIEKRGTDRYPSMLVLAQDLEAYLDDRPVSVRQIGPSERLRKLFRRNRAAFVGAFVVVATLVVMAVGFGTVLTFNLDQTSDSLRALDEQAALDQVTTLERAINTNMSEGRPDVARNFTNSLLKKLKADKSLTEILVVRPDTTLAYTDMSTAHAVGTRIANPTTRAQLEKEKPKMVDSFAAFDGVAKAKLDKMEAPSKGEKATGLDLEGWNHVLATQETFTEVETIDGVPYLTVMKPIKNGPGCQPCHGAQRKPGEAPSYAELYGNQELLKADPQNRTRAVLVVRRSQAALEEQIAANTRSTLIVGAATTAGLLLFIFIVARVFGLRLRPRKFG